MDWALRDYKTEGIIWDGKEDCEHDFQTIRTPNPNSNGGSDEKRKIKGKDNFASSTDYKDRAYYSSFCSKCNAWKGQLGQEPTIDLYVSHLVQIFDECKRVLKKEGTCWVVIGDTYSGNVKAGDKVFGNPEFNKNRPSRAATLTPEKKTGLQDKTLCMIPERFAIAMIDKGWILRNKIIWHKRNCMPSSAKDRFTVDYEYVYFFTKSQKYYFKTQYEPIQQDSIARFKRGNSNNHKWIDGPAGQTPHSMSQYRPNDKTREWTAEGRIKRCVWTINTKPFPESHFAVFPEQLVKQCLDAGCPENGICLDMFLGSGTTALVALKNNRRFIGIELSSDYIKIALKRIEPYLYQAKLSC